MGQCDIRALSHGMMTWTYTTFLPFFLFLFIPVHQAWIVVILLFEEVLSLTLYLFKINLKPVIDRNSFMMLGKLLAFGIFPMFNLLLNTLNYKVDVVMLKHQTEYAVVSMYGKAYEESYAILIIMLLSSYGMIYTKMITTFNVVEGKQKINLCFMIVTVIANIVANYLWIPKMGMYGAAWASVISYNLCGLFFAIFFIKRTNISVRDILIINRNDIHELRKLKKAK